MIELLLSMSLEVSIMQHQLNVYARDTQVQQVTQPVSIPPILHKVAKCESGDKQFDRYGKVIRGKIDPRDVGKFQINEYWNGAEAKRLGFDLETLEGNTHMALHLYRKNGLRDWKASKHCWASAQV